MHALLGLWLIAASACALNQWLECSCDAMMERTARRPLPAGRLSSGQVLAFAFSAVAAGSAYLCVAVNWGTAVWGLLGWTLYVWIYTPLKSRTALNTVVGALAGASPTLLGWSATGATADLRLASLFLIMFLWQFPHLIAIDWIYREQYRRAGLKTFTVVDPSGRLARFLAVSAALTLLPISLGPALFFSGVRGAFYVAPACVLGLGQLACAVVFCSKPAESTARLLLRATLAYLPLWLALLALIYSV
jgi:protoheme IX farnesyltransferase